MRASRRRRAYEAASQRYYQSIYALCDDVGFSPTFQQRQLLDLVQGARDGKNKRRIAVRSGQGPGKTRTSGICALWWNLIHKNSMTVLTAPTMRQCKDVWLKELRRVIRDAPSPIIRDLVKVTKTRVEIAGNPDWGVQLVTATSPEGAQGAHEKNMSVIVEEASGVSADMLEQYKGTTSNPNSLFVQIGNPNKRDCGFFDCFNSMKRQWAGLAWNAEDTPASDWFDPMRNELIADEFGIDSDVYRVRVKGEFPREDPNTVISEEALAYCTEAGEGHSRFYSLIQKQRQPQYGGGPIKQIGIDLARFGGDETVIVRRSGNAVVEWVCKTYMEPRDALKIAFEMQYRAGWTDRETVYVVDASGIGQGLLGYLSAAKKQVYAFHNGSRSTDPSRYANKITEAWFSFRNRVKTGEVFVPRDNRLAKQLTTRQYALNKDGQLVVEPKDQYVKRHESPDRAEAILYAFFEPVQSSGRASRVGAA